MSLGYYKGSLVLTVHFVQCE